MPKTAKKPTPVVTRATSFEPEVAWAVGFVVRSVREAQDVAQDRLALIAGVDRSYYGKLERGERQPTVGLLMRIGNALGVPASLLVEHAEILLAETRTRRHRRR